VDEVRERSGQDSINILGYCMGGTMSTMYASLHPEKVQNLALMAAGLCFAGTGGVLEQWGGEEYFDPEAVTETFHNVPAGFLDVGFALMDPVQNYVTKYVNLYENVEDEDFVENFARMEEWLGDGIDVAGATFNEFIEDIYQQNKLMENELYLGGEHVDIENIDMPVLQIVAEYDHLIPPEASKPFNDAIPSDDKTILEFPTGHIGMSVSSKSHAELWPDVCDWFEARMPDDADAVDQDVETKEDSDAAIAEDPVDASAETPDDGIEIEVEGTEAPALTDLDGVGPAYAEDLADAGYESLIELANADPATVAAEADLPVSRVEDWIDQAQELAAE